ncbi:hypothetical protein E4T81_01710 [Barnesiella sp. WM24]|uniref:hypothetical protein n=1 Tax=Barnesiella sp. WM24 TaxID=2558278 RepID=UPI0010717C7F|nr:hypothetical protein [Barnesiella sp. WM24]TFU95270.1 hypothetical protein E4T81_01710 [Barnesiella sp. WM24]
MRKDGLQQLAAVIGVQVANEEEANEVVGKLTADKVSKFVTEWRKTADAEIAKANKTHEDGLRRKYDFKEKEQPGEPQPGEETPPTGGALTAEQIRAIIREENKVIRDEYASLRAEKTVATRREQFVAKLEAAKIEGKERELMLRSFDRIAPTFKDDEDFNGYLNGVQGDLDAIAQERSDKGLLNHEKPLFGAVNKEGISAGVADYIASQSETNPALTGKEI